MRCEGIFLSLVFLSATASGQPAASPPDSFDRQLEAEVVEIERHAAANPPEKEKWLAEQKESRRQLAEMLGLDPTPPRGDLHATKTGEFEHESIIVENLHYQSLPGLYVTANLYRPKDATGPVPAVLYLCGHANKQKDGISYGNKTGYEHHGVWYAKHGMICLMVDTVQLGEIRGSHHGTHSENRWDWISRGYTPAGVEAWAGIRGIDYLVTRPEVNQGKIGVTGRSGGGAYSWWVSALDERVTCAAPTAGITTLRDHVVHKCVYGHCDCMFTVNTYRWDYDRVASLVAPRPLLIANTDKDAIFPIDGVFDLFRRTRAIYEMLGAGKNLGLQVAEGGHADVQPLNTGEFHWMLRHLKNEPVTATYDEAAVKSIPMEKLRVFRELPADEKNTTIDRSFVPLAQPPAVDSWEEAKPRLMKALREKVFSSWEGEQAPNLVLEKSIDLEGGLTATKYTLRPASQGTEPVLDLYLFQPKDSKRIVLHILDSRGWHGFASDAQEIIAGFQSGKTGSASPSIPESIRKLAGSGTATAFLCPRGEGPYEKQGTPKDLIQLKRSFYLTGATLESWQVWDIRGTIRQLRALPSFNDKSLALDASSSQAVNAIYASLFEEGVDRLELRDVPSSHTSGSAPAYLNVLKYLDIPTAAALASAKARLVIHTEKPDEWRTGIQLAEKSPGSTTDRGLNVLPAQGDNSAPRTE